MASAPANGTVVSDPSDFTGTPLAPLSEVDSLLRCQICKDFYTNAVLTSCFHTFCSICIRRCLAVDGRCPTCRTVEQESKLRRNVAVQEVVDAFVHARDGVLGFAREAALAETAVANRPTKSTTTRGSKRKRQNEVDDAEADAARPAQAPRTRSQRKKAESLQGSQTEEQSKPEGTRSGAVVIDDSEDETYEPASSQADHHDGTASPGEHEREVPEDGLVPCPICSTRMKPEAVFTHLDSCDGRKKESPQHSRNNTQSPSTFLQQPSSRQKATPPTQPPPERLPQLNYSLFKETALRKKLQELGIPAWGSKTLLARRHTEWINLWNANCDSARPRPRKELLSELDAWERSQGGRAANAQEGGLGGFASASSNGGSSGGVASSGGGGGAAVMKKDFDGQGWARRNKDEFDDLIAKARSSRKKVEPKEEATGQNQQVAEGADGKNTSSLSSSSAGLGAAPSTVDSNPKSVDEQGADAGIAPDVAMNKPNAEPTEPSTAQTQQEKPREATVAKPTLPSLSTAATIPPELLSSQGRQPVPFNTASDSVGRSNGLHKQHAQSPNRIRSQSQSQPRASPSSTASTPAALSTDASAYARRRYSQPHSPASSPLLPSLQKTSSLPDRVFASLASASASYAARKNSADAAAALASLGVSADDTVNTEATENSGAGAGTKESKGEDGRLRGVSSSPAKKVPMFEVPREPILDADVGDASR